MARFSLGFTNAGYLKEVYRLEKQELELLKEVGATLDVKNKSKYAKNIKYLNSYLKKYVDYLFKNEDKFPSGIEKTLYTLLTLRNKIERYGVNATNSIKNISKIPPGARVVIVIGPKLYFTSIIGERSREYFVCSYPSENPELNEIEWKNKKIKFYYSKKGDALYNFDSTVIEAYSKEDTGIIRVKHPKKFTKRQRRAYPRVHTNIPATITPATVTSKGKNWKIKIHDEREMSATIKDLSAGGFALNTNGVFEKNEYLKLSFPFLNNKTETLLVQVVRSGFDKGAEQNSVSVKIIKQQINTKINLLMYTFDYYPKEENKEPIEVAEAPEAPPAPPAD